jgi:predicted nucleotidyltransferase
MRLTQKQITQIKEFTADVFGEEAQVYLFGSRLDEHARGGDIDLLVKTNKEVERPAVFPAKLAAKVMMANHEQKVDVVLIAPNLEMHGIHKVALREGVLL